MKKPQTVEVGNYRVMVWKSECGGFVLQVFLPKALSGEPVDILQAGGDLKMIMDQWERDYSIPPVALTQLYDQLDQLTSPPPGENIENVLGAYLAYQIS